MLPQILQQAHLPVLMMWYRPFCRAVAVGAVGAAEVVGAAVVVAGGAVVVGAGVDAVPTDVTCQVVSAEACRPVPELFRRHQVELASASRTKQPELPLLQLKVASAARALTVAAKVTELSLPQAVPAVRSVLQPARPPATVMVNPPAMAVNTQRCRPLLSSCSMAWRLADPPYQSESMHHLADAYLVHQASSWNMLTRSL